MALESVQKIAINFAVVFIVAAIFSSLAPEASQKAYAFFEDKLGLAEPSIGYLTVNPKDSENLWVEYSVLGNYNEVEKVVVYIKAEVPPKLGSPDSQGIYKYEAPGGTPLWYRYKDGEWQWTPYEPKENTWMPVTITAASEGKYEGREVVKENADIIKHLRENTPEPRGGGVAYEGGPSLTDNVVNSLKDATPNGVINAKVVMPNDGWYKFTVELHISNSGDIDSKDFQIRLGRVPAELGLPDSQGIYKYESSWSTPLWYRYKDGEWQWTPYEPKENTWMPVTTTVVESPGKPYHGKKVSQANIDIINYLAEANPKP